jgi:serine/threonine-protein kinase
MALVLAAAVFGLFVFNTSAPKDTIVPNIRGMTRSEAEAALAQRSLTLRVVQDRHDERVPPGTIFVVNPPEGTQVKQGKAVEVWISKGPQPIVVPNLIETMEQDARSRIREASLSVGAVRSEYDETIPKGTVISQDPAAGTEVRKKTSVSMIVSRGPEPLPPPEPDTAPETIPPPVSSDDGVTTDSSTDGATDNTTTDGGTLTLPLGGETDDTVEQTEIDKNRIFDISTKIEGSKGWSRIRILLTDERGRREVVNELYRRGQTVRKTVKAMGEPGSVRIEVYENRRLVKDERH